MCGTSSKVGYSIWLCGPGASDVRICCEGPAGLREKRALLPRRPPSNPSVTPCPSGGTLKVSKPLVVGAVVAAATGIAIPTLGASGNKYDPSTVSFVCKDNVADTVNTGTVTLNGPLKLWPPNHKMIDEPVTAQRDASTTGGSVTLTLTPT